MFALSDRSPETHDEFEFLRRQMVERQIRARGIGDERILAAMASVRRHCFVPLDRISDAYADVPLPIGERQTISQPFMVAAMADALQLKGSERVLEIGAGSGYQAAVLSLLAREIIAVESRPQLASMAGERLARLGFSNIRVESGDGSLGWKALAPYDAIIVSCAAPSVPQPLVEQLVEAGRLVVPVGNAESQQVMRLTRRGNRSVQEGLYHCRFVPLVGRHGWPQILEKAGGE